MFIQDSIQLELSPGAQLARWPVDGLCMKKTPIYILIIYGFLLCLGVCEWGGGVGGGLRSGIQMYIYNIKGIMNMGAGYRSTCRGGTALVAYMYGGEGGARIIRP